MQKYYISSTKYSLQERQTKKNGKVYDVVFRIVTLDGVEKQKKLSGFKSKSDAKAAYTAFVTENCTLVKNNPLKKKNTAEATLVAPTVRELIPQYIISLQNQNKDSSIYSKQSVFELFVLPSLGGLTIPELTKERLYQWQDELWTKKNPRTGEHYSFNYLKKARGYFNAFLAWCESRHGYTNNLTRVTMPKKRTQKTEMQIWTREEFEQFISAVDDPMYHALFTTMFFTGRRKGEVLALTPEDVKSDCIVFNKAVSYKTLNESLYTITSTKAEKKYTTPICEPLRAELDCYVGQFPFFFGGDRPLPWETVRRRFDMYIKKADVKRIRLHDLRHSFVSMLIHLGANMTVVADLIGDTIEQVTKTYGHMYEEDKISIMRRLK